DNSRLDFPRGYHIEVGGGFRMPGYGVMGGIQHYPTGGGWGSRLKDDYRRYFGATVGFAGRGEMVPSEDCYCEIDPDVVDRWGIPVRRIPWKGSDHEIQQAKHMQETFRSIVEAMGGQVFASMPTREERYGLMNGGSIIHELGCVRMGDDPSRSVLDANCRAHEVPNLFVADGGPFVSQPDKNPTWTILALSMRTSEYIAQQMNEGAL